MSTIVIKDLPESTELDHQAMQAIAGGSRFRTGPPVIARPVVERNRLFDLSSGRTARPPAPPRSKN